MYIKVACDNTKEDKAISFLNDIVVHLIQISSVD